jgi:taurine dioxygenase
VSPDEHPEITVISNVVVDGKSIGGLGSYEAVWHADMTYNPRPPKGSALYAVEIPPAGGNTYFANMYRAYETLPGDLKRRAETLKCIHDASRNSAGELRVGRDITDPREAVAPCTRSCARTGHRQEVPLPWPTPERVPSRPAARRAGAPMRSGRMQRNPSSSGTGVAARRHRAVDNRCTMRSATRRSRHPPAAYRTQITGEDGQADSGAGAR